MKKKIRSCTALLMCAFATFLLSGCRVNISIGINNRLTGDSYPNAEAYQVGAFTCPADDVSAVEVYWRSGEVEIIESDDGEIRASESGGELPEDTAMHCLLDDGVLKIRFCESGAEIRVNPVDKHLNLEIPEGISLSVHTTSALTKADTLNQKDILIAAHSGNTELGAVTADTVDLSSSSGVIRADSVSARSLTCNASSGAVDLGTVSTDTLDCRTSSGDVTADDVAAETLLMTTSSGRVDAVFTDVPSAEIHTSSGRVDLTLADGGAEVLYTASSGTLHTSLSCERRGDLYVFGDGESSVTVETSSGNLKIR